MTMHDGEFNRLFLTCQIDIGDFTAFAVTGTPGDFRLSPRSAYKLPSVLLLHVNV